MARYPLAAAAAIAALAVAAPVAAKGKPAAGAALAGSTTACAIPAYADDPVLPPSADSDVEDKIDQLTGIIAELSDRLQSLEDAIGEPDDQDGGDPDENGFDLAHAKAAHRPGPAHRNLRILQGKHSRAPKRAVAPGTGPEAPFPGAAI